MNDLLPNSGGCESMNVDVTTPWTFTYPEAKSAREQVQEEILSKVAQAIGSDDLAKAKELLALAKALKEL
jgi:hypothetical protein